MAKHIRRNKTTSPTPEGEYTLCVVQSLDGRFTAWIDAVPGHSFTDGCIFCAIGKLFLWMTATTIPVVALDADMRRIVLEVEPDRDIGSDKESRAPLPKNFRPDRN